MELDRVSYRFRTARFDGLVELQVLKMSGYILEVLALSSEATCKTNAVMELISTRNEDLQQNENS